MIITLQFKAHDVEFDVDIEGPKDNPVLSWECTNETVQAVIESLDLGVTIEAWLWHEIHKLPKGRPEP